MGMSFHGLRERRPPGGREGKGSHHTIEKELAVASEGGSELASKRERSKEKAAWEAELSEHRPLAWIHNLISSHLFFHLPDTPSLRTPLQAEVGPW